MGIGIMACTMPYLVGADFAKTQMRGKLGRYPAVGPVAQIGIINQTIIDKIKQLVFCALFTRCEPFGKATGPVKRFGAKIKG